MAFDSLGHLGDENLMINALIISIGLFGSVAFADPSLPDFKSPELIVRAHPTEGYNLPRLSYLNSTSPVINNKGDISFKLVGYGEFGQQALWFKSGADTFGRIVFIAPELLFVSDPSINEKSQLTFNVYNDGASEGLYFYDDNKNLTSLLLTAEEAKLYFFAGAKVLDNGTVVFRGTSHDEDRNYYRLTDKLSFVAKEGFTNYDVPSAYLFTPAVNAQEQWAFKVRVGARKEWSNKQSDQILLLTPDATVESGFKKTLIAQDKKGDSRSPYVAFENFVSLSDNGKIVFVAVLENKKRALILVENGEHSILATQDSDQISEFELFPPKINNQGLVIFRAKSNKGLRGIYIANKSGVKRLIGESDAIPSDLGLQYIMKDIKDAGLAGTPDINDNNQIVFSCILVNGNDRYLGETVYLINPK